MTSIALHEINLGQTIICNIRAKFLLQLFIYGENIANPHERIVKFNFSYIRIPMILNIAGKCINLERGKYFPKVEIMESCIFLKKERNYYLQIFEILGDMEIYELTSYQLGQDRRV